MIKFVGVALTTTLAVATFQHGHAASARDVDNMTTLATSLGRAMACKVPNLNQYQTEIGNWFDRTFPARSAERLSMFIVFAETIKMNYANQISGKSPDSCLSVPRFFESTEYRGVVGSPASPPPTPRR